MFHISIREALTSSFVIATYASPATSAAIAATAIPTGLVIAARMVENAPVDVPAPAAPNPSFANAADSVPSPEDTDALKVTSLPTTSSSGPIAATTAATATMAFCVPSSRFANLSTRFDTHVTASFTYGISMSPMVMDTPSSFDFRLVICPWRLSCMTAAVSFALPLQWYSSSVNPSTSPLPAFSSRFSPLTESAVNVDISATFFSASPIPFVAASTSFRISVMLL